MRSTPLTLAALLVGAIASSATGAQQNPLANDARADAPKVYHAGGKHDQRVHEAALKARADGQPIARPTVHPGGKHDARMHEAAIQAEQKRRSTRD